jgi:hypothetical protein
LPRVFQFRTLGDADGAEEFTAALDLGDAAGLAVVNGG